MFPFPQASPLLTKQGVEVSSVGENVVLRVGNVDLTMHYEHALALSAWVRQEASYIKKATGRAKVARSLGTLHDASAKAVPLPLQAGTAIHVRPKLHEYRRSDVSTYGRLVLIKIGLNTISLHFESAFTIAQWLRMRAKESRNRVGDTRHWSEIATDPKDD